MKTTLIAIHQVTKDEPIPLYGSLGILALSASLRARNIECEVIDLVQYHGIGNRQFIEIQNEIVTKILSTNPKIIGFSTISDSLVNGLLISRQIKKETRGIVTVFGGPGVSYCANEVITRFPEVDYIIRGEADYALPEFISEYSCGNFFPILKGLVYQQNNQIFDHGWPDPVSDLDQLPVPLYEFCKDPEGANWFDNNFGFFIEAGRGCPYNCNFCSTSYFFKRKFRVKSVERIIAEIKSIHQKSIGKRIILNHDLLTFNHDYIKRLCDGLMLNFSDLNWGCNSRLDTIDHDLLKKMSSSGCSYVYIGIEVATEKMQKSIGKKLDLSQVDVVLNSLHDLKYDFVFSFIIGLPEEEISDVEALFSMALKAKLIGKENCLVQIHPLMPELGSRIFQDKSVELFYDADSSIVDTAIPRHWSAQWKIISENPDIFARFYSLKNTMLNYNSNSSEPSKYSFFAYLVEKIMKRSLVYAYTLLGDTYSPLLINCFDTSDIVILRCLEEIDFTNLLENIRSKTCQNLNEMIPEFEIYNTIAKYEIAVFQVLYHKSRDFISNIEVNFTENEIIEIISNPKKNIKKSEKKYNLMLFWDSDAEKVKCMEIPPEFASLINQADVLI
jgi:radical SAM superfamily enzyme YgiQ (UPF0313 family)